MSYDYKAIITELIDKTGLDKSFVYDYTDKDPHNIFGPFFDFCQTNLIENSKEFDIQPAKIFFRDYRSVNAAAIMLKPCKYYIIRINYPVVSDMYKFFTDYRDIFKSEKLADFTALFNESEPSLDFLMFQLCTLFTFYHEKAHLGQLSPHIDGSFNESYEGEPDQEPFDLKKHLMEFDADCDAAHYLAMHLIEHWKHLPTKFQTTGGFNKLVSAGMAGVLSYFIFLAGKYTKMYYKTSDHPHPLIRISYIMDNIIKTIQANPVGNIGFDAKIMLQDALRITETLFEAKKLTWISGFAKLLLDESDNIEEFVNQVLIAESLKVPELIMNRRAGDGK